MIINLIYWSYLTLVSLVWGNLFTRTFLKNLSGLQEKPDWEIACLAGLSIAGCLAFYLSFFFPLDWKIHILLDAPVVIYLLSRKNRRYLIAQFHSWARGISVGGYFLLGSAILVMLLLSSAKIIHPDTLAYHAQSILWFQRYPAIPGLAHLRLELGLQSVWFAIEALFNPFPDTFGFCPAGGCIACWFLFFIIKKIGTSAPPHKTATGKKTEEKWIWMILLVYTMTSWTQLRLTAASESPDFIVSLLILGSFYIFYQAGADEKNRDDYFLLATLFACTAITGKLSSVCICLLPVLSCIYYLQRRRVGKFIFFAFFSVALILPLLVRNFLASGYLLYPSGIADWFTPDWKLPVAILNQFQHYITDYARFPTSVADTQKNFDLGFFQWIPRWWKHLSNPDRVLLFALICLGISNILFAGALIRQLKNRHFASIFFVTISGSLLWFFKAPDPRFGTGFLLGLLYMLYLSLPEIARYRIKPFGQAVYLGTVWLLGFSVLVYSVYRIGYFFNPGELVKPAGISRVEYKQIKYEKLDITLVGDSSACGLCPLPCVTKKYLDFIPRGNTLTDGFKSR